uniref:Ycf35 n=1 Tax=Lophurella stichidiosa TaxID=2008659 RepID=UPI002551F263|nr:Ycf35 [Aphanocladia stichidiosa]WGH14009.1 Ycf35 [Aphanocladia stichidiosa]
MSHFSKIKTNITNLNVLIKTIKELGFNYKFFSSTHKYLSINNQSKPDNILVYKLNENNTESSLFTFTWNASEYILLVDLDVWNLDISFNYLLDRLFQQYAYNIVINTSSTSGFQKIKEQSIYDGSIKLTLQRWNNI